MRFRSLTPRVLFALSPMLIGNCASAQTPGEPTTGIVELASPFSPTTLPQQTQRDVVLPDNGQGEQRSLSDAEPLDEMLKIDARGEIERVEQAWESHPISDRALFRPADSTLPFMKTASVVEPLSNERGYVEQVVPWHAPATFSNPTYFEDVDLERYGYTRCLQPVRSGFRFYADVISLPWEMLKNPPRSTRYTLGYERPGTMTHSVREKKLP